MNSEEKKGPSVISSAGRDFEKLTILADSMISKCFVNHPFYSVGVNHFCGIEAIHWPTTGF
jgi:hypothetical protein